MDSGQSPVEINIDQESESKALPGEETASTVEQKEQSKLAQVCTFSDTWLPGLQHNVPRWSACTTFQLMEQKQALQNSASEAQATTWLQTLQDGISSAAKAVEHSIKHGQPLDFVDTRPVADLLNEVGHGDLSTLDPSMPGKTTSLAAFPWELQHCQSTTA